MHIDINLTQGSMSFIVELNTLLFNKNQLTKGNKFCQLVS